jgi:hypothetical protein
MRADVHACAFGRLFLTFINLYSCSAGESKANVFLGRADDGEDPLAFPGWNAVVDGFLRIRSTLAHELPQHDHNAFLFRPYFGFNILVNR